MPEPESLPSQLSASLAEWSAADLPAFRWRVTHPYVSRALHVLRWICAANPGLNDWRRIKPSMVQLYCRAHGHLKPATLRSYVKALRRWLRWLQRDDFQAPDIAGRLRSITPPETMPEPKVPDQVVIDELLSFAWQIYSGSRALYFTRPDGRRCLANMTHWAPGGFRLLLRLGLELGLRPWEAALLRWDEFDLRANPPRLQLRGHELRPLKTAFAATPLLVCPDLRAETLAYQGDVHRQRPVYPFAVADGRGSFKPPHYDSIWRALRQRFGLPWLNARALRRKFATDVRSQTPSIFDLATATRHVRLDTLNHYVSRSQGGVVDPKNGSVVKPGHRGAPSA